jgi:hypothetical protein
MKSWSRCPAIYTDSVADVPSWSQGPTQYPSDTEMAARSAFVSTTALICSE